MSGAVKLIKPMLNYLKSKGLQLILLTLIPSLLTAFLISPSSMLYLLCGFFKVESFDFVTVFKMMLNFNSRFYYIGIIGVALYVFVVAILFGTIDRHMRIGEFSISFHRAKTRIDYNFLTAFKMTFVVVASFEIYNVLNVLFVNLWVKVFASLTAALVFSIGTFLVLSFVLTLVFSLILLWPPFMLHTGQGSFEAFRLALRQNSRNALKLSLVLVVSALPFIVLMLLSGFLGWGRLVRTLLDGLCLAWLTVIYSVTMYTIFYEVTGLERLDLQIRDIWKKRRGV